MEGDEKGRHCNECGSCLHKGGCCGGGWHGHYGVGHMLVKILIAILIFWAGYHVGQLSSFARGGYMMGGWGYDRDYGPYGPGMMYRGGPGAATTTAR